MPSAGPTAITAAGVVGFTVPIRLAKRLPSGPGRRRHLGRRKGRGNQHLRRWVNNPNNAGQTTYHSGTSVSLYMTSSSVYNADGEATATTAYVGGTASNRLTQYGYDWRDRQDYQVEPANARAAWPTP